MSRYNREYKVDTLKVSGGARAVAIAIAAIEYADRYSQTTVHKMLRAICAYFDYKPQA